MPSLILLVIIGSHSRVKDEVEEEEEEEVREEVQEGQEELTMPPPSLSKEILILSPYPVPSVPNQRPFNCHQTRPEQIVEINTSKDAERGRKGRNTNLTLFLDLSPSITRYLVKITFQIGKFNDVAVWMVFADHELNQTRKIILHEFCPPYIRSRFVLRRP